jgi:hypothetical protein
MGHTALLLRFHLQALSCCRPSSQETGKKLFGRTDPGGEGGSTHCPKIPWAHRKCGCQVEQFIKHSGEEPPKDREDYDSLSHSPIFSHERLISGRGK